MLDTKGSNLVFLLCVPRSGSSLATVMLQNHSSIFALQEMWLLLSRYDLRQKKTRPYGGTKILDQLYNGILTDEQFERACRAFAYEVYNGLLHSSGASLILDKSPRYYLVLEFLDRLFPRSKRIWLVRNPLDIAASYKKVHQHLNEPFDLSKMITSGRLNMHLVDITIGLHRYTRYFSRLSSCSDRVHYEEMTAKPQETARKLCQFLGLEYEAGMERYGDHMQSEKSKQFFSMGVGDPFLARHTEPHQQSVNRWKEILTRDEVAMYIRAVGGSVFHELGYSDQLAEAERWSNSIAPDEPDEELISSISEQLSAVAGYSWEADYQMQDDRSSESELTYLTEDQPDIAPELLRLQMRVHTLEHRLENIYIERDQYRRRYEQLQSKIDHLKSLVPFSNRLSRMAFGKMYKGGKKI